MSFSRVNAGGWSVGAQLTSAQMNALDADHANALDKSVAGDQLAGQVTMASTASIQVNHAGASIVSSQSSGIQISAAAALLVGSAGGISLAGSPVPNFPVFQSSMGRTIVSPADCTVLASAGTEAQGTFTTQDFSTTNAPVISGITYAGTFKTTVINNASAPTYAYYMPLNRFMHNGATLSSANLYLLGASGHSALPLVMPAFGIYRQALTAPVTTPPSLASGAGYAIDPTATVAAYKLWHTWSFNCNQNNVIDTTQYTYFAVIWDEANTNALGGNQYAGLALAFTTIADMRFP